METVTIVSILVIAFLLVFVIIGWCKGFLRIILTTLSLVVTLVVAAFLLHPVTTYLTEHTGFEKAIEVRVEKGLGWDAEEPGESSGQLDGKAKEAAENDLLSELKLPGIIKNMLIKKNTVSEYIKMGVDNFRQYIVRSLSSVTLKIVTYIALVIAIYIIIRILLLIVKAIEHVPVVRGINRFFGAIIGFIEGSLILWLLCLGISLIAHTEFGSQVVDVIRQSAFLSWLYEENLVLRLMNAFFALF